jgi:hypothetical protein
MFQLNVVKLKKNVPVNERQAYIAQVNQANHESNSNALLNIATSFVSCPRDKDGHSRVCTAASEEHSNVPVLVFLRGQQHSKANDSQSFRAQNAWPTNLFPIRNVGHDEGGQHGLDVRWHQE